MFGFLIVLLCIVTYFYYRQNGYSLHPSKGSYRDALEIVRVRYARGEMSSEEFNERIKALE